MKDLTLEHIFMILAGIGSAIVVWRAAVSVAKSVLQKEVDDRLNKLESRMDTEEERGERSEGRIDKLYDRLIQKNS